MKYHPSAGRKIKVVLAGLSFLFIFSLFFLNAAFSENVSATGWFFFKGGPERQGVLSEGNVKLPLKIVWRHTPSGKTNGFVDWGPVATEGVVYTPDGLNNILALDSATGEIVWQKKMVSNVFSVSLSEDARILYVTTAITTKPTATLFALDPKTGEDLWNNMTMDQPAVGGMEGAPVIVNGKIYVAYLQYEGKGGVMGFDGTSGKLLWHWSVPRFSPYSPVSYEDGRLYVGFENKALVCLSAKDGKILWTQTDLKDLPFAAPTLSKGVLYEPAGNTIYAMDSKSGKILWQVPIEGETTHSSIAIHDKTLYFGTRESKFYALQASHGEVVWTVDLASGPIESSPLVDVKQKQIFLGTQGNVLFVLDLKNGKIKDKIKLSEDVRGIWKSSPAIYRNRIYVGSLDQTFYALE